MATDLMSHGIPAMFMTGQELDLKQPGVKVLTLQSAKGLEFPIVALAGFLESSWHTSLPTSITGEEREEMLALEWRTLFVGMTRAMRALLIVLYFFKHKKNDRGQMSKENELYSEGLSQQ